VLRLAPLDDGGVLGRPASVVTESAEQEGQHDHGEQDDQKPIRAYLPSGYGSLTLSPPDRASHPYGPSQFGQGGSDLTDDVSSS
jgi:hypothetical protein